METIAYLELAQDYVSSETSESKKFKISSKAVATTVTLASTAWAGGLLTAAPALAYNYGCCRPVVQRPVGCCRPVVQRPVDCCRPVVVRPVVSRCHQPCYYPQAYSGGHDSGSYYPDYYSYDQGYEHSYNDCDCSSDGGSQGDYHEIAFHPENPNLLKLGASGELVALLQQTLTDLGFDPGPVDGLFGHQTKAAVAEYQAAAGLLVDGIAGGQTLDSLGLAGAGA
jgi:Putative peptidoglycan binding domain